MALAVRRRTRSVPATNNLAEKRKRRNYRTEGTEITEWLRDGTFFRRRMCLFLYCSKMKKIPLTPMTGARGFMRGVRLHYKSWKELFDDKEHGGLLVPILVLAH